MRTQLPPYNVVLMNSDVAFDHVVTAIMNITSLSRDEAIEKAMDAHQNGRSTLLICHRERAELYKCQFAKVKPAILIETEVASNGT